MEYQGEETQHIIKLFKEKFISPYKIIYMIDQTQADHFKARNTTKGSSCCSSQSINIPTDEQTPLEKGLAALLSTERLKAELNGILEYCEDRYRGIAEKGKKDELKITEDVQKYLIDSIMSETINQHLYQKLVRQFSQKSSQMNSGIARWATPATWYAKYPKIQLSLFQSANLGELLGERGWTKLSPDKMRINYKGLADQLLLLEKDGRFQEKSYLGSTTEQNEQNNEHKVLQNPEIYCQEKTMFPCLRSAVLSIQSIPFQLNMKANAYLTVSENTQIVYYKKSPVIKNSRSSCKFFVLYSPSGSLKFKTDIIDEGDLLIVDCQKNKSILQTMGTGQKNLFIILNWIYAAEKK